MSVYVDSIMPTLINKKWKYSRGCHLVADTVAELHSFAACLGLKREWYQYNKTIPHYDLTANKRREAVKLGAIRVDAREFVELIRKQRSDKDRSITAKKAVDNSH